MGGTQVAGEDNAFLLSAGGVMQVDFHIGRTEDMPRALQANTTDQNLAVVQGKPDVVRQCNNALLDHLYITLDLFLITTEAELEGIFQDDGHQLGRWLTAEDRPFKAGSQEIGNAPDMVDMHMGRDQGLDGIQREFDG